MKSTQKHLTRAALRVRDLARVAMWSVVSAMACVAAAAQDRPADILMTADAEKLLSHPDPRVRGEAALATAATAEARTLPALLRIVDDEEPRARAMGLLALGFLGAPGAESALLRALPKPGGRTDEPALAAAFALARLPADLGSAALNQRLSASTDASFKRERETILAMLSGLLDRGGDDAAASLERLARDASLRDPHVRAAALAALSASPRVCQPSILGPALRASSAEIRCAALRALARHPTCIAERLEDLVTTARGDDDARVRAAALACLTEARHLPALEIATRAAASADPEECAQGVASLLRLGGDPKRRALARQFAHLGTQAQRILISTATSPMPENLLEACREAALDKRRDAATRHVAILALLRTGQSVATDLVLEAFAASDWATQQEIAAAVHHEEVTLTLLSAVTTRTGDHDLNRRASMLAALILAEAPGASLQCARWLAPEADAETVLVAIRALRQSRLPRLSDDARAFLPELLRPLLLP